MPESVAAKGAPQDRALVGGQVHVVRVQASAWDAVAKLEALEEVQPVELRVLLPGHPQPMIGSA